MAEPTISFLYNYGNSDVAYSGTGSPDGDWKVIDLTGTPDKKIYTGGGILGFLSTPTEVYGTRDATIKPNAGTYVVPQVYIESTNDNIMYNVPLATSNPNTNRYVFGAYVNGLAASDLYIEMWDDDTFSTTDLPTLSGSVNYPYSMFNCIKTTNDAPPGGWTGATASGAYLAGATRLGLRGASSVQDEAVYFNMYVRLPYDTALFHNQPVETYRYLYI